MKAPTEARWMYLCASLLLVGSSATCWLLLGDAPSHEAQAIARLKAIYLGQLTFREQDLEGDGIHDYAGNEGELVAAGLLPPLPAGAPYRFVVAWGEHPEFTWMATAEPSATGAASDRCFAVNWSAAMGVSPTPVPVTPECTLPPVTMELMYRQEAQ